MRIGSIHMGLEAFHQMDPLLPVSVDEQMKSVEEEMQWKCWSEC